MRDAQRFMTMVASVVVSGIAASSLAAQEPRGPRTRLLVLDLAPSDEAQPIANRIFSLSETDADNTVDALRCYLSALSAKEGVSKCPAPKDGARPGNGAEGVLAFIRAHGKKLAMRQSGRWVSKKGDSLQIFAFHLDDSPVDLSIQETARKTRIANDLRTLAEVGLRIVVRGVAPGEPQVNFSFKQHYLAETRATLTVSASSGPKTSRTDTSAVDISPEGSAPSQLTASITTGPKEHVFLSANAALTQLRQTKYDSETKTLDLDEKPTEFLIGVNYALGDLLQDDARATFKRFVSGMFFSLLVEASTSPFDQLGATIGFRHSPPKLDSYLSFETVSPYVGVLWARNDHTSDDDPNRIESAYGKRSVVWGLSLNLDKALGWLGAGT